MIIVMIQLLDILMMQNEDPSRTYRQLSKLGKLHHHLFHRAQPIKYWKNC